MEIRTVRMLPFRTVSLPPYTVKSIEAAHALNIGDAVNYIINDGTKVLLFASDTGVTRNTYGSISKDCGSTR